MHKKAFIKFLGGYFTKRSFSVLLVLSLLCGMIFPVSAETYGDLTYTIVNDEVAITRCSQFATGSIHIPSELEGFPVTRIYGDAFINCTKVTRIYIPSSVVKIESGAFAWISNLEGIYVDENNQNYCSDNGILFNKNKSTLFRAPRSITEYVVPDSVTTIGSNAFNGCKKLSEVNLGKNVTIIGDSAFEECTSLTSIKIPDSVRTIEGSAFYRCSNLSNVEFGNSVTEILGYAFNYCYSLTSISLPDSVTNIERAFNQCTGLTSIDIGEGVTSLKYRAFWGCSKLSSITIGSKFKSVGSDAFEGCESLINVYYYGTEEQWQNITISDGNFYLTGRATIHYVHDCQWDEGTVTKEPSCVPGIKTYTCTWPGCGKTKTEILDKITDHIYKSWSPIDIESHQGYCVCGAVETTTHNWDKAICTETRTCLDCGATSQGHIWIAATCTEPKTCAICNSTAGTPVHNIIGEICTDCNHYGICGQNLIWSLDKNGVLTITGTGAMSDYDYNTFPWYSVKISIKYVEIGNGVTTIGSNAFSGCTNMEDIKIPNSISTIGSKAFYHCHGLKSISIPESVSSIDSGAFSYCNGFESFKIPDAVTVINYALFKGSKNLKHVTLGRGVTEIGTDAFRECINLQSINIPTTITSIQTSAFNGCDNLSTLFFCGTTSQWESLYFVKYIDILLHCERIQHSWVDPTCIAPKTCAFCGKMEGPVSGHIYDNACDDACNICGDTRTPADHTYDNTCDTTCNVCNVVRTVEHNYGDWINLDATFHTRECACGYLEAELHTFSIWQTELVATCTDDGVEQRICSKCELKEVQPIPATGHSYNRTVTPPTCSAQGYTTHTCTCGDTYKDAYVPALNHQSVNGICANCGETLPYIVNGDCGKNLVWMLSADGILTISGSGAMSSYSYSTSYSPWYNYRDSIKRVVIEDGVTSIGNYAFYYCNKLTAIALPNSITKIGSYAFYNCYKLTSITIPAGVSTIPSSAFTLCKSLQAICIPTSVTSIESLAFYYCDSLKTIYYYCGSQSAWDSVKVGNYNDPIKNATIEFHLWKNQNTTGSKKCAACGYGTTYLGLTSVTIRPSAAGIYFTGTFEVQDDVDVVRKGIAVSIYNQMPVADGSDPQSLWSEGTTSVLVSNILNQRASDSSNATRAATPIYARAYIELSDGTYIYSDVVSTNLREVTEAADTQWATLDDTQKAAITAMYTKFKSILDDWNLSFAESKPIDPAEDVLIISNTQTISNQTIDKDVYITFTGVAIFENVTINGNIYCYGQLIASSCTANDVYAYAYGTMMSCDAFDGTHGKVSGGISCDTLTIQDDALDYAFDKWGKQ